MSKYVDYNRLKINYKNTIISKIIKIMENKMKKILCIILCFIFTLSIMLTPKVSANDIGVQAVVINENPSDNNSIYNAQLIHEDYTILGTILLVSSTIYLLYI